jgi:hypothetical protein
MKNWKAIVGVFAIFLLGMVAGGLVVGGVVARRVHRLRQGQPVFTATEVTRFLQRKLDLDATQRDKVRAIVSDAQGQALKVSRSTDEQVWGIITNAVAQMRPALRPGQQEKLDQLLAERRSRRLE